jgi:hypothetical protein
MLGGQLGDRSPAVVDLGHPPFAAQPSRLTGQAPHGPAWHPAAGGLQRSKDAREEPDWESEPLDVEDAISRYLT